jgi:hypothetical protein
MHANEVPERSAPLFEGLHKAVYVTDDRGRYLIAKSGGSEAEVSVTEEAVSWFSKQAAEARERALRGETSPLEVHMCRQRMDIPTLAQATGFWRWQVRRHLRPRVFARLDARTLVRYAEAMGVSVARLQSLD